MPESDVPAIVVPVVVDASNFEARLKEVESKVKSFGNTNKKVIGKESSSSFELLASRAKSLIAPIAAAAAGFATLQTALAAISKADNLNRVSAGLGVTVESLQELQYVADISGSSAETMTSILERMTTQMENMKDPASSVSLALANIGLNSLEISRMKPDTAFIEIADALSKVEDRGLRSESAMKLFGRQAKLISGVIDGGAVGIRRFSAEANRMGAIISQEVVDNVAALGDEIDRLNAVSGAAGMRLTGESAEGLSRLVVQLTGLLKDNAGWLSSVGGKIADVFGYASVSIRASSEGLKSMAVYSAALAAGATGNITKMNEWLELASKIADHSANVLSQTEDLYEGAGDAAEKSSRRQISAEEASLDRYIAAQDKRSERMAAFYAQEEDRDVRFLEGVLVRNQTAFEGKKSILAHEIELNNAMMQESDQKHQEFISTKKAREYQYVSDLRKKSEESMEITKWEAANREAVDEAYIAGRIRDYNSFLGSKKQRDRDYWQDLVIRSKQADEQVLLQKKFFAIEEEAVMKEKINNIRQAEMDSNRQLMAMWAASWQGKMQVMEGAMGQTSNMLGNLANAFDKTSRRGFEMWKKMATAQAIVDTLASAVAAFKGMVTAIPGPVGYAMGVAAAAAAVASGMANVRRIQQTQFDGGGSSASSGYSSPGASGEAVASPGQGGSIQRVTNVNVSLQGRTFDQNQVRSLIGAINEAAADGARMTVNLSNVK